MGIDKSTTVRPTSTRGLLIGGLLVITAMVGMVGYKNSSVHEQPLDVIVPIDPMVNHTMNSPINRAIPSDLSYTVSLTDPYTTVMGFHPTLYIPQMPLVELLTTAQLLRYGRSNISECEVTDVVGKSVEDISYAVLACEISHGN